MMREAELDDIRREVEKVSPAEFRSKLEKEIGADEIKEGLKIEEPAPVPAPAPTPEPTPTPEPAPVPAAPKPKRKPKPKAEPQA